MASDGGAAGDSGENLSPMISNDEVSDDRHTGEAVWAALVIMFISNGGYEQHNNLEAEKKTVNTSTPPKKYKSLAQIYGKGKAKVVDSSDEDEKDSSDSDDNNIIGFKNFPKKKTTSSSVAVGAGAGAGAPFKQQSVLRSSNVGLSLSIVSFLWVVRIALITPASDSSTSQRRRQQPPLSTKDVIRRVTDTFGQAHLLTMKVPWEALVRAVLRIFSSTTPPSGLTSFTWQPLATFEKNTRSWSWTGPILSRFPDGDSGTFDITTPEAWGVTGRVLFKLVESFTEWLKAAADCTFSQIAQLPNPSPVSFIQQPTLEERFKDDVIRYMKKYSICTISPTTQEAISYFHKEEALRYLIPERAFEYTTADGNKKATVVPLIKCSKQRHDNFILKPKRPPSFNVVCLVRDAAARLPDGVGTIADICLLVKDSHYIIQDVSEDLLEEVVSGALNRLHFQLVDRCVEYNKDSGLWTYRHGERERIEEDFTSDCTSSKKRIMN